MVLDANSCLEAGKCLVITNNQYYIFIGVFVVMCIFFLLLLMISFFTPAIIFLKAKLKKASLIYTVNRGQTGEFLVATGKYQGIADVPKVGPFIVTEGSHTIEKKSKVPFYFAFGEFASTLPLEYAYIVQELRGDGERKITNIDDLADYVGMEFSDTTKAWVQSEDKEQKETDLKVEIKPYKTIKIHDLAFMFPFNVTPALMESKTQHMIGLKMSMFNKMNMQYVLMFIMILMGTVLAAVIAFKFLKTGDTTGAVQGGTTIIERIVQAAPVGNLTG